MQTGRSTTHCAMMQPKIECLKPLREDSCDSWFKMTQCAIYFAVTVQSPLGGENEGRWSSGAVGANGGAEIVQDVPPLFAQGLNDTQDSFRENGSQPRLWQP